MKDKEYDNALTGYWRQLANQYLSERNEIAADLKRVQNAFPESYGIVPERQSTTAYARRQTKQLFAKFREGGDAKTILFGSEEEPVLGIDPGYPLESHR